MRIIFYIKIPIDLFQLEPCIKLSKPLHLCNPEARMRNAFKNNNVHGTKAAKALREKVILDNDYGDDNKVFTQSYLSAEGSN